MPSIQELLEDAAEQSKARKLDTQMWLHAEADVRQCNEACQELQELLQSACPKADAGRLDRVFKNVGNIVSRKGKTAAQLLSEIHGYLELLRQRRIVTNSTALERVKKAVDELFQTPGITQNNVNGPNIGRDQIFNRSTCPMFNGPGATYNAGGK